VSIVKFQMQSCAGCPLPSPVLSTFDIWTLGVLMERRKPVLAAQGETIRSVHKGNDLLWGHNSANLCNKREIRMSVSTQ
jgi:hypothetical protein